MSAPGEKKDQKQEIVISSLLSAPSLREAAKEAGISEATLHRWLKDDAFKTAYRDAKRELVNHAICHLQQSSEKAVKVLLDVAENKKCPASARVSAAKTILEISMKAVELEDLEGLAAKINQIEKELKRYHDEEFKK
jgi:transposase-like protein